MKASYFILFFFLILSLHAQRLIIKGVVTDEQKDAIPGVDINVKGTDVGTFTTFDGEYWIKAQINDTLVFSFYGYITQEIPVKSNVVNVQLALEPEAETTVTVTSYGIINGEKTGCNLEAVPSSNFSIRCLASPPFRPKPIPLKISLRAFGKTKSL